MPSLCFCLFCLYEQRCNFKDLNNCQIYERLTFHKGIRLLISYNANSLTIHLSSNKICFIRYLDKIETRCGVIVRMNCYF